MTERLPHSTDDASAPRRSVAPPGFSAPPPSATPPGFATPPFRTPPLPAPPDPDRRNALERLAAADLRPWRNLAILIALGAAIIAGVFYLGMNVPYSRESRAFGFVAAVLLCVLRFYLGMKQSQRQIARMAEDDSVRALVRFFRSR